LGGDLLIAGDDKKEEILHFPLKSVIFPLLFSDIISFPKNPHNPRLHFNDNDMNSLDFYELHVKKSFHEKFLIAPIMQNFSMEYTTSNTIQYLILN